MARRCSTASRVGKTRISCVPAAEKTSPVAWERLLCFLYPHAGDLQQDTRLQRLLVEPVLHQVADADDAFQNTAVDHRQMADPADGHGCQRRVDAICRTAGH